MDGKEITAALTALAGELERRGTSGEMYVVGGAAIALAFDERRATRDIDAVFEPKNLVYEAAATVAARLDLPPGWLNDAVKGFLEGEDPAAAPVLGLSRPCRTNLRRPARSRSPVLRRRALRYLRRTRF